MDSESSAGEGASDPRVPLYEKLGRTLTEALTVAELAIKASTGEHRVHRVSWVMYCAVCL